MKKNSRQDDGGLSAHVAGQRGHGFPGLYGFCRRRWHRIERISAIPHPGAHSLAQEEDEPEATADSITQHIVAQLLVPSDPIFRGRGLRQGVLHCGFF